MKNNERTNHRLSQVQMCSAPEIDVLGIASRHKGVVIVWHGRCDAMLTGDYDERDDADRYFLSPRLKILRTICAKLRPEPSREPLPPPPKHCAPPRREETR
jgi:hypothetical protein